MMFWAVRMRHWTDWKNPVPVRFLNPFIIGYILVATACTPSMIEHNGFLVFNPEYLYILESKRRDRWQKPCEVIQALGIKKKDVIADIGAGGGYFMEHFSQAVGEEGLVYATDVQPVMVEKLWERARTLKLNNVRIVHASFDDPSLPSKCCDLVFFSSVYKEISDRIAYMNRVHHILKPHGRVAIIEFRLITLGLGPPLHLRLSKRRVIKEMKEAGFKLIQEFNFLPREYFLIFSIKGEQICKAGTRN